ncbi:unnamed protein product [Closterium sp. Yama58-4]|nr:unnamed protein product [Closterium sp. Yama58-4]
MVKPLRVADMATTLLEVPGFNATPPPSLFLRRPYRYRSVGGSGQHRRDRRHHRESDASSMAAGVPPVFNLFIINKSGGLIYYKHSSRSSMTHSIVPPSRPAAELCSARHRSMQEVAVDGGHRARCRGWGTPRTLPWMGDTAHVAVDGGHRARCRGWGTPRTLPWMGDTAHVAVDGGHRARCRGCWTSRTLLTLLSHPYVGIYAFSVYTRLWVVEPAGHQRLAAPRVHVARAARHRHLSPIPNGGGIEMLEAGTFDLHCFQTLTGTKFFIATEVGFTGAPTLLAIIYDLYTDYVLKNPFYECHAFVVVSMRVRSPPPPRHAHQVEMPIRCDLFDLHLPAAIRKDRSLLAAGVVVPSRS